MDHILVFGATGGTGRETVKQALERGLAVTAVVRNPAAYNLHHPNLTLHRGDVLQLDSFANVVAGKTAVISCLGTGSRLEATTVYSQGVENIVMAMRKARVERLICVSAGALYTHKEMGIFVRIVAKVIQFIVRKPFADLRIMEKYLQATADIHWSIVRPPRLLNTQVTGSYRVAVNAHLPHPFSISRADAAHYMLGILNDARTFHAIIEIGY